MSQQIQWPFQRRDVRLGSRTVPLEVWLVAAAYALASLLLLISAWDIVKLMPDALSGLFSSSAFEYAISWLVLMLGAIVGYAIVALAATAYLVSRCDPVGRGLAVVVLGVLFGLLTDSGGSSTTLVVIFLLALASVLVLFASPYARAAFARPEERAGRPWSVVLAQTLLVSFFTLMGLIAVVMVPGLRFLDDLGAEFFFSLVFLSAASVVGLRAYRRLQTPDRRARTMASGASGAMFVALLLWGHDESGVFIPLVLLGSIVALLWVAPSARAWFGDPPLGTSSAT